MIYLISEDIAIGSALLALFFASRYRAFQSGDPERTAARNGNGASPWNQIGFLIIDDVSMDSMAQISSKLVNQC